MKQALKTGRNIGAALGGIAFLAFGLVPAFYFGSYGTIVLLSHLVGEPLQASVLVRAAVVVGSLMGIFCMASVSIVVGSILGTAMGWLSDAITTAHEAGEKEAKAANK
jgi:hypothetical protein